MADLHPIVVPAIEYTYKSIKYTCAGEGILKDGYLYDLHAEKLIPPKSTKAGAVPKEIEKKPAAYWKAQCAFRGLNQTGSISDLQVRVREAKKKMMPELKEAEKELNKEFRNENKSARDGTWNKLKSAEQKAKADPGKYLNEAFPKGNSGRPANLDIVVLKIGVDDRSRVTDTAESMGLEAVSVDAPWSGNKKPSPDRWLIIGRIRDAVWDQMRDIDRQASRSREEHGGGKQKQKQDATKRVAKEKATKTVPLPKYTSDSMSRPSAASKKQGKASEALKAAKPASIPQYSSSPSNLVPASSGHTKQTARKSTVGERYNDLNDRFLPPPPKELSRKKNALHNSSTMLSDDEKDVAPGQAADIWDIRGTWSISCPEIDDQWPCDDMSLNLYLDQQNSKQQMYGTFDFGVLTGIMRFQKSVPVPKSNVKTESGSSKRKREEDDDDGGDMNSYPAHGTQDMANEPTAYTKSVFHLGSKDKPTARRPTWNFRWRGEETGEGEIVLCSDERVQTMTFIRKGKGLNLKGTLHCGFIGECKFTGTKISDQASGCNGPESEWTDRSQDAYERGTLGRWR